jgi:hypothetical protein
VCVCEREKYGGKGVVCIIHTMQAHAPLTVEATHVNSSTSMSVSVCVSVAGGLCVVRASAEFLRRLCARAR